VAVINNTYRMIMIFKDTGTQHMIDTIVLTLPQGMYTISDPDRFTPSAAWACADAFKPRHALVSKQNRTKKELLKGVYKPRLTLSNRIDRQGVREITLKIELSLPKLLFGNNFAELRFKDFTPVADKLVAVLAGMGVVTTAQLLAQAPVSTVHYSKNFRLTDGSTPFHYINKIKEANVKLSLDINQTDYRNAGHSYKWHCNAYEVVFYDKIKDLATSQVSAKRAIEPDGALQVKLLDTLRKRSKLEVLRMEVRLNKRQKIKQLFKQLNITADITFKKLFKPAIAKKVLLHYLDQLECKRLVLLDARVTNDKALLAELIINNPDLGPKQIMQMFGLRKALDVVSPRELRVMFSRCSVRSWYRLMTDAQKVKLPNAHSPLRVLREQLVKFEIIKNI